MTSERFVQVRLARVVLREGADQQWIFLQEVEGERGFPIVIGNSEASEIHRVLANDPLPRPLTHQLALAAVEALGSKLLRVDIVDLRNNTFFARLVLAGVESGVREVHVDARPSDALALALRAGAPLRVAESVLEQARTDRALDELSDDKDDEAGSEGPGAPPESD
jgi:bifunctional DNase/RNase